MKKTIGICVPCYNEEGNVNKLYKQILKSISSLIDNYEFKILFIDNCSTDNTQQKIKELAEKDKNILAIFNSKNFGPGRSGAHGFFNTPGDAVITMACDLQDPPALIPKFIERWEEGYGVILGRKTSSGESKKMYATRKLYYSIMSYFVDDDGMDQITGFGLYDRKVISLMNSIPQPNPNFRFLIAELGLNRCFIEYTQEVRNSGKSSYNFSRYLDTAIDSLISNSYKPIRFLLYIGVFLLLCSILFFIIVTILCILNSNYLNLVYLLSAFIFLLLSVIIIALAGIGEYITVILQYNKKLPLVTEKQRINF